MSAHGERHDRCLSRGLQERERVLFVGIQFSDLYTAVDMPEPRNVHDVCVLVCKGVYVCPKYVCFSPGALHSRTSLLMPFLVFRRSHLASCREDSR